MAMQKRYYEFHGKRPKRERVVDFHVPKGLIILGEAVAVEYRCSKLHGGGDGTSAVYRHEFETKSYVCMDETGKRQIYILGPKITVTEAGIEN